MARTCQRRYAVYSDWHAEHAGLDFGKIEARPLLAANITHHSPPPPHSTLSRRPIHRADGVNNMTAQKHVTFGRGEQFATLIAVVPAKHGRLPQTQQAQQWQKERGK